MEKLSIGLKIFSIVAWIACLIIAIINKDMTCRGLFYIACATIIITEAIEVIGDIGGKK